MNKILTAIFIVIFISGCSIKEVSPPVVTYHLEDNHQAQQQIIGDKILKIARFKSPNFLQSRKIWYQEPSGRIGAYLYSTWNENFTSMVAQSLTDNIFKSGLFKSVYSEYSKMLPDLLLEANIVNAVQNMKKVSFEIRVYVVERKSAALVATKAFIYQETCDSIDAKGAVDAYQKILNKFNKDVILWLKRSVKIN
ncbi:ABC-type transport auxiliary lipoprotein family protein [Sulfurospirillum sp. 1612]|uniref:ABC-type transport auxiliary lipoprotein family protein n=1 Tax=Sulfurospirillum sp. 1612 TaxID=3094835 RepID=UPI002F9266D2